jgi:hypothetical protein
MATAEVDRVSSLRHLPVRRPVAAEVDALARAATVRRLDRDEYLSTSASRARAVIVAAG